jgi:hypothetical protein
MSAVMSLIVIVRWNIIAEPKLNRCGIIYMEKMTNLIKYIVGCGICVAAILAHTIKRKTNDWYRLPAKRLIKKTVFIKLLRYFSGFT